jgi:hypothetical protein
MMNDDPRDLIIDILDRVKRRNEQFTDKMALEIEQEVRKEWAGERVYIGKRKAEIARAAHKQGADAKELQKRFGVSRSWAFRLTR